MNEHVRNPIKGRPELPGLPHAPEKPVVNKRPLKRPPREKIYLPAYALPVSAVARGALMGTALQNLIDARFQDFYRLHYTKWIQRSDSPVVFTHQFLPRLLQAHWDPRSGRKAVVMVFDGLRTDAWDEFLRPVFEERFEVMESRPGSALIPTETHLSRKAISAGCLPYAFTSNSELHLLRAWLERQMGLNPWFEVVKDDDTIASGMTVRYVSDQLEYIVNSWTDR